MCPLEPVACEFVDIGCNVMVARRELSHHLEESQQHHVLLASLLNLRLTNANITEKDSKIDEQKCQLAEKDKIISQKERVIAKKDEKMAEKDMLIAEKDETLSRLLAENIRIIAEKDRQILDLQTELRRLRQEFTNSTQVALDHFLGLRSLEFSLNRFSKCQKKGVYGDWYSEPFHSQADGGGYCLRLNVETKQNGPNMRVRFYIQNSKSNQELEWPVTFIVTLQLLNQLDNHYSYSKTLEISVKSNVEHSDAYEYIAFNELYGRDMWIQYLKDDCLKFRLSMKIK